MKENRILWIATLLTILIRLLLLQQNTKQNPFYDHPILDSVVYLDWAESITKHTSFFAEEYHHPPGYAFFLACVMAICGWNLYAVLLLQNLMFAVEGMLVFLLTRALLKNVVAAWLAFCLFSLSGPVVFYSMKILSETLYCTLLLVSFFFLVRYVLRDGRPFLFFAGAFLGMAMEVRGNAAVCIVAAVPAAFQRETGWKRRLASLFLFVAGVSVCVLPVLVRNVAVAGAWTPVASNWGENFYFANNPTAGGTFAPVPQMGRNLNAQIQNVRKEASRRSGRDLSSLEAQRFWFREGLRFLITQPWHWLKLEIAKIHRFFSRREASTMYFYDLETRHFQTSMRFLFAGWGLLLPLSILGIFAIRKDQELSLLFWFVLLQVLGLLVFWPELRFLLPLIPFLCVVAGNIACISRSSFRLGTHQTIAVVLFSIWVLSNWIPLSGTAGKEAWYANASAAFFARRQYTEAVQMAQASLRVNPKHADAWVNLGAGLYHSGQKEEARQAWQAALQLDPDLFPALRNMAVSYETEDPRAASAWWKKALDAARTQGYSEKELRTIQEQLMPEPE